MQFLSGNKIQEKGVELESDVGFVGNDQARKIR
jgi:hypothetical protein